MKQNALPFGKENYMMIIAGVVFVIIGFMMMAGGASENPNDFKQEELFSATRITYAPMMVILGYCIVAVGMIFRKKSQSNPQ